MIKPYIELLMNKIALKIPQSTKESFFLEQFYNLKINNQIDALTFNNYTGLPLIISQRLFTAFNTNDSYSLNKEDFVTGMCKLYNESYLTRLELIFSVIDYNNTHQIHIEEVKLVLLHFHLIGNKGSAQPLFLQVDKMFKEQRELNFIDFLQKCKTETSDIARILLIFFHKYFPLKYACVEFYHKAFNKRLMKLEDEANNPYVKRIKDEIKGEKSTFSDYRQEFNFIIDNMSLQDELDKEVKAENDRYYIMKLNEIIHNTNFIEESQFFNEYINMTFDDCLINHKDESLQQQDDDSQSELDELISFENNVTQLISVIVTNSKESIIPIEDNSVYLKPKMRSCNVLEQKKEIEKKKVIGLVDINKEAKYKSKINYIELDSPDLETNKKHNSFEISARNNTIQFMSECMYDDIQTVNLNTKVTIIGNMLFVYNKREDFINHNNFPTRFKKILLLNKLFIENKSKVQESRNSYPVNLISTLLGKVDTYTFIFNKKSIVNEFISIIKHKTNHRKFNKIYNDNDGNDSLSLSLSSSSDLNTSIRLITKKNSNNHYALKIIPLNYISRTSLRNAFNELSICKLLSKLSHPNIVKFTDFFETVDHIYIIMEYLHGFTIDTFLQFKPELFKANKTALTDHLINGLHTLHYYGIVHRNIKPENIMIIYLKHNDTFQAKYIDFAESKIIHQSENYKESFGSLMYASPEVIMKQMYSCKIDIWSLGVMLYLFIHGKVPFYHEGITEDMIMKNIVNEELAYPLIEKGNDEDEVIEAIVKMCLVKDSMKRSSSKDLYHFWLSKVGK